MAADKMSLEGDNSYGFKRGVGKDYFGGAPGITTIRFDGDLTLSDFKIRLEGGDLVFYLIDPANPNQPLSEIADVFYFDNWIANDHGIERFEFSDGTAFSDLTVSSSGQIRFYGTDTDDVFVGTDANEDIYGSAGADTIDGGGGHNTIRYNSSSEGVTVNLVTGEGSGGDAEGDQLSNIRSVYGSEHDDVIVGDAGNNGLYALGGNDRLEGGAGNDWLNAYGSGDNYLDGGSGNDTVRYRWSTSAVTVNLIDQTKNEGDAAGDTFVSIENVMGSDKYSDHITGDAGNNKLWGYGGDDTLDGGDGNDTLLGGKGNDTLKAGNGIDILEGGTGDDEFFYGEGTTTFRYDLGDGNDTIHVNHDVDVSYNDKVVFGPGISPDEVTVTRSGSTSTSLLLTFKDGGTITLYDVFHYGPNYFTFGELHFADGTVWNWETFNKMRFENAGDEGEELAGTLGDDVIDGRGGDDKIDGYTGDDHLIGGAGNDTLQGHDGDDHLEGGAGNDKLSSSAGNNILDGGDGNDTFFSITYGEDQILGGSGDDTIYAVTGTSVITGGEGDDTINVSTARVAVHYDLGDGNDIVDFWYPERLKEENHKVIFGSGISSDEVTLTRANGTSTSLLLTFKDGGTLQLKSVIDPDTLRLNFGEIEFADGTIWNWEDINERLLDNLSNQADHIGGTNGDDIIDALGGDDRVYGEAGNDHISGGDGNDIIIGGDGDDVLYGGDGNDTLNAGEGDDHLEGGSGDDTLEGYSGKNILDGGDGDDVIVSFSSENNKLLGGAGNDNIFANGGSSIIEGGTGDDFVFYRSKDATFLYNLGDGNDTLEATSYAVQPNKIVFGADILPSSVVVAYMGEQKEDLQLTFADGGTIVIIGAFHHITSQFDFGEFHFADGTIWTGDDISQKLENVSESANPSDEIGTYLVFSDYAEFYSTNSLDDLTIFAGAGDDIIESGGGNDQIHGEAGDDTLTGGEGNNAFYFGANFGKDVIKDFTAGAGSVDTIHFSEGAFDSYADVIAAASEVGGGLSFNSTMTTL
ncbi:calcium-binding protein [Pseudovibrio denitrificans]|uniref:calcium-binding protein n=1 Tax=Pseudovibrio denitrificans TaxID=258256 RepID=UPI0039BF0409